MTRPGLRQLAKRLGILDDYLDNSRERRYTEDATREAICAAMGFDASTEEAAAGALAALDREDAEQIIAPFEAVPEGSTQSRRLRVRVPPGVSGPFEWTIRMHDEVATMTTAEGTVDSQGGAYFTLPLPSDPAVGYHRIRLLLYSADAVHTVDQTRLVAPASCHPLDGRTGFGFLANLYTMRSERNRGFGDLGDLRALVDWAAETGASFVGINPLHMTWNRGDAVSPYHPVSRLFHNPLYLDVEAVPELAHSEEARQILSSTLWCAATEQLRRGDRVDYQRLATLAEPIFRALYRAFVKQHRDTFSDRERAYDRYLGAGDGPLRAFAAFQVLDEHFRDDARSRGWRAWPAQYHWPDAPEVQEFLEANRMEASMHIWVQFELERQLAEISGHAADRGLDIGLFGDLALGSAPGGLDHWAFRDLFVDELSIGAPPDDYAPEGQDWGLPPIHPRRLALDAFQYWILLVRSAVRHMGALRLDHVMGLFRQFWKPRDAPGAYVRFPARELLAILAIESRRAGTVIIGEDLGTLPHGLASRLARRGILSTRVLYFQRDRKGGFARPSSYSPRALVTANTHDHAPLAGFRDGVDLQLRRQAGAIPGDPELEAALRSRAQDYRALLERLRSEGELPHDREPSAAEFCAAVYRFLARTPSPLLGVALDDLAGETEPINLPGVPQFAHASWTRRMHPSLDEMRADPDVVRVLDAVATRGAHARAREVGRSRGAPYP